MLSSSAAAAPCLVLSTILVLTLLALAFPRAARAQPKPRPYTLILDFVPTGEYVPHYTALEKGWYRDEGLDVKILRARARRTRSSASPPVRARSASRTSPP